MRREVDGFLDPFERDLLIASIALARNLTIVTHNLGEFTQVPALKTEDWH